MKIDKRKIDAAFHHTTDGFFEFTSFELLEASFNDMKYSYSDVFEALEEAGFKRYSIVARPNTIFYTFVVKEILQKIGRSIEYGEDLFFNVYYSPNYVAREFDCSQLSGDERKIETLTKLVRYYQVIKHGDYKNEYHNFTFHRDQGRFYYPYAFKDYGRTPDRPAINNIPAEDRQGAAGVNG